MSDYQASLPMLEVFVEMGRETALVSRGDPARHKPLDELGTTVSVLYQHVHSHELVI